MIQDLDILQKLHEHDVIFLKEINAKETCLKFVADLGLKGLLHLSDKEHKQL